VREHVALAPVECTICTLTSHIMNPFFFRSAAQEHGMASSILDRLHENGRMAVETVRCVVNPVSISGLSAPMKERLRAGVERRLWEIIQITDQLELRECTPEREQMLRVAKQVEQLWDDIARRIGINDDLKLSVREAA
jgi:hypothetical protein